MQYYLSMIYVCTISATFQQHALPFGVVGLVFVPASKDGGWFRVGIACSPCNACMETDI